MNLTPDVVFALIQSTEVFPVDFDDAIVWWDCRTKQGTLVRRDNLLKKLKDNFDEDIDYHLLKNQEVVRRPQGGGSAMDKVFLTVDCFKSFGMMVSGERGKQIRRYFIDCETELKRRVEEDRKRRAEQLVSDLVQVKALPWRKRFDQEIFDHFYRIKGSQPPVKGHPSWIGRAINSAFYELFPDGTLQRLWKVNPRQENGRRRHKHHQHLTAEMGSPYLDLHKARVLTVMRLSPSNDWKTFEQNLERALGKKVQLELPFMYYLENRDNQAS